MILLVVSADGTIPQFLFISLWRNLKCDIFIRICSSIHTLGAKRMSPVPIFGKILRRVHLLKNTLALAT
jgi:hypothetical protein